MNTYTIAISFFLLGGILLSLLSVNNDFIKSSLSIYEQHDKPAMNESANQKEPLYWVAPMDKNYRRDKPGLSPMGMDLVPVFANETSHDQSVVEVSPAMINNLGVNTTQVSKGLLYQTINTLGNVQFDEAELQHIHSRVEGWIDVLNISSVGERVSKGQTLFELYSPELVNAQEEYLVALQSDNAYLVNASQSKLLSLGVEPIQINRLKQTRKVVQRVKVFANTDGVITKMSVRQGMFIKPMTEILSIGSIKTLWVIGEVYERQSHLVKSGQHVELKFSAFPDQIWQGEIDYVYPTLNLSTRTTQVRIPIDNPNERLKPNMIADLKIKALTSKTTLNLPIQSIIKTKNNHRVVELVGEGRFKSKIVKTGLIGIDKQTGQEMIQVLDGINLDDTVVKSAHFLIDSESNIEASLERVEVRNEPLTTTQSTLNEHDHSKMDHSKMGHSNMNHSKMDHSKMSPIESEQGVSHAHH